MTPAQAKAIRALREEIERLEADGNSSISEAVKRLDNALWTEMGGIQNPAQRRPICEALAYRRAFPDWTPAAFVEIVGADPVARHPYAACMGFREIWPPFKQARDRDTVRDARIQRDAELWLAWLRANDQEHLAQDFSLMFLTDEELDELERRLDI